MVLMMMVCCNNDRDPNNMHQRTSPVEELQAGPASGQDIPSQQQLVTRRMQRCGSIGARPALAAAVMHSRRRALQCDMIIWITGRVHRVVVRLG
jgi:hypothetical protein